MESAKSFTVCSLTMSLIELIVNLRLQSKPKHREIISREARVCVSMIAIKIWDVTTHSELKQMT